MTASARATANVANASLSTSPRTEEGKARSSCNAVRHGLPSKHLVIAPGEEEEFAELHDSLFAQLSPEGPLEMGLFNMHVHAAWNMERFRALEAQLMTNGLDSLLDERTAKTLDRLQRYAASNQRAYFSARFANFAPSRITDSSGLLSKARTMTLRCPNWSASPN